MCSGVAAALRCVGRETHCALVGQAVHVNVSAIVVKGADENTRQENHLLCEVEYRTVTKILTENDLNIG